VISKYNPKTKGGVGTQFDYISLRRYPYYGTHMRNLDLCTSFHKARQLDIGGGFHKLKIPDSYLG
jgi:hypothetical protein